jgi:hypothetical protein
MNTILQDINNLLNEGEIWNTVKSDLHNLGDHEASQPVTNKYIRNRLKEDGIKISSDELDELASKRAKKGFVGGIVGTGLGSLIGTGLGVLIPGNPNDPQGKIINTLSGGYLGAALGGMGGSLIGRSSANKKFIRRKLKESGKQIDED